jgi:hypothetical protein
LTGEIVMARSALIWGALIAVPAALLGGFLVSTDTGWSIGLAALVVLGNVAIAAGFAWLGDRMGGWAALAMALPSFAVRMIAALIALVYLRNQSFIEEGVFVASFALFLTAALFLQSRTWRNTPWLARAYATENQKETV